ncbi:MAG: tRNA dihydrouridine synthase DusB [Proteobacteria bacterium]|nr:tRNA dihydrouridine synthase DusB [Pseudomonadota bacterium]
MLEIGSVSLNGQTVMAPLAGITNLPFRLIAKEAGCALVCSEMISANGLVYKSPKTLHLLDSLPDEKPLSVQIFGSKPSIMAEAARMIESSGADILDINFGCSVRKVTKTGAGVALMRTPDLALNILKEVRKAIQIPLTIKIRTGWDSSGDQAVQLLKIAEDTGVDAITIHPRTATQGFRGQADWSMISKIKKLSRIPVIGNGDITTPETALDMIRQTGCDGVMVGRSAIGNPMIFNGINSLVHGENFSEPDLDTRFAIMNRYLEASISYIGEITGCKMMRSRLSWFVKGLPGCSEFRKSLTTLSTLDEAKNLIETFRANLS